MDIVLVLVNDDWQELQINGMVVAEGHTLGVVDAITALGYKCVVREEERPT